MPQYKSFWADTLYEAYEKLMRITMTTLVNSTIKVHLKSDYTIIFIVIIRRDIRRDAN